MQSTQCALVDAQMRTLAYQHHDVAILSLAADALFILHAPLRHDSGDLRGELCCLHLACAAFFFLARLQQGVAQEQRRHAVPLLCYRNFFWNVQRQHFHMAGQILFLRTRVMRASVMCTMRFKIHKTIRQRGKNVIHHIQHCGRVAACFILGEVVRTEFPL